MFSQEVADLFFPLPQLNTRCRPSVFLGFPPPPPQIFSTHTFTPEVPIALVDFIFGGGLSINFFPVLISPGGPPTFKRFFRFRPMRPFLPHSPPQSFSQFTLIGYCFFFSSERIAPHGLIMALRSASCTVFAIPFPAFFSFF